MRVSLRRILSLLLTITLIAQFNTLRARADDLIIIKEGKIEETLIKEEFINETLLEPEYIREHLVYEDNIYEYRLNEQLYCETFLYEVKITPKTIENLADIVPPQFNDYNIDWISVIGKFAIGTTIIIAVGVVDYLTTGTSTFFIMATPGSVAKDAFLGGVIGASLNVVINDIRDGRMTDRAALKYAIEGFAEGYMWGAITSVLKVGVKNFVRLKQFKTATGGLLKIKLNGDVIGKSGETIGKAYYDSSKVWHLVNEVSSTTTVFDSAGKELATVAGTSLPKDSMLRLGTDESFKLCYTDSSGMIYRIDDNLKPNITYELSEHIYHTDSRGRISSVEFDHLTMVADDHQRLVIADSWQAIGKGSQKLNDQKGHLIADMFNGDNTMANIVPQAQSVNQSAVKRIEMSWFKALKEGKNVKGSIKLNYKGKSFRPSSFTYSYDTGSGLVEKTILNK